MIQPIGNGENKMSMLDIDWNQVAKEAQAIDDKYNAPKEQRNNVTRQTSGNMYSQKNQHRIAFLDGKIAPAPQEKEQPNFDPNLSKKLNNMFDPENRLQTGNSVMSARCSEGGITDEKGSGNFMGSVSGNSIWDSEKLQRLAGDDPQKISAEAKQQVVEERKTLRQETNDKLAEMLESVDQRKASSISPAGDQTVAEDSSRHTKLSRNISIFDCLDDSSDFTRLPEMTGGEKVAKSRRESQQKVDDSWRDPKKASTSKDVLNNMFDSLMNQKDSNA